GGVGWVAAGFGQGRYEGTACPTFRAELSLAKGNDFHGLQFLALHRAVHAHHDPVVIFDPDLISALDLLAGQRAAFLLGAYELGAGLIAGSEAVGDRAAQAAGPDGRELLLGVIIAQESQAFEGLTLVLALNAFLDEAAAHDLMSFSFALRFAPPARNLGFVFPAHDQLTCSKRDRELVAKVASPL